MYDENRKLHGSEVVIDKDFASALLAKELDADLYIMATDTDAIYIDWGKPEARPLHLVSYDDLKEYRFAAGSMGPKVAAGCWFAEMTKKSAAIGALSDIEKIVKGEAGTIIGPSKSGTKELFGIRLINQ